MQNMSCELLKKRTLRLIIDTTILATAMKTMFYKVLNVKKSHL